MKAKLEMLKDLLSQMQVLMAEGEGDSKDAGEEAMECLGEPEKEIASSHEMGEEEEETDIKKAVREAFKPQSKAPMGKGSVMVMKSEAVMPKFGKKKAKGLKYG
jgi:hypothetical protein